MESQKMRDLRDQIEREKHNMARCDHDFDKPFENTEIQKEEYLTGEYSVMGIDRWPITAFRDKPVKRWTRVCKKCGLEQHAYDQKPIVSGYEPNFDNK